MLSWNAAATTQHFYLTAHKPHLSWLLSQPENRIKVYCLNEICVAAVPKV